MEARIIDLNEVAAISIHHEYIQGFAERQKKYLGIVSRPVGNQIPEIIVRDSPEILAVNTDTKNLFTQVYGRTLNHTLVAVVNLLRENQLISSIVKAYTRNRVCGRVNQFSTAIF
jgi:hypothetical protein